MPLGTPVLSEVSVVHVGTANPPTTPVGGLVGWDLPNAKPTSRRDYHGQASFNTVGKANATPTLTCDYETADSGQIILSAAWISGNTIYLKVLPDGTNGEIYPVKVSERPVASTDANGYPTIIYSLAQQGAPTVVGGGMST